MLWMNIEYCRDVTSVKQNNYKFIFCSWGDHVQSRLLLQTYEKDHFLCLFIPNGFNIHTSNDNLRITLTQIMLADKFSNSSRSATYNSFSKPEAFFSVWSKVVSVLLQFTCHYFLSCWTLSSDKNINGHPMPLRSIHHKVVIHLKLFRVLLKIKAGKALRVRDL